MSISQTLQLNHAQAETFLRVGIISARLCMLQLNHAQAETGQYYELGQQPVLLQLNHAQAETCGLRVFLAARARFVAT